MLKLLDLTTNVRVAMVVEFEEVDVQPGEVYLSARLNQRGRELWPGMLSEAARSADDRWLAAQLRAGGMLLPRETTIRHHRPRTKAVPHNAAETLAEGEFNRLYIRGLCREVLATGGSSVVVYRAGYSENPRYESQGLIGRRLDARLLLDDLRASKGRAPSLLPQINTGLSVHVPSI